jgi:hypothetical protein
MQRRLSECHRALLPRLRIHETGLNRKSPGCATEPTGRARPRFQHQGVIGVHCRSTQVNFSRASNQIASQIEKSPTSHEASSTLS